MKGKTVVITGATSGIGEVAALALARMGARIVAVARSKARGDATLARLRSGAPGVAHTLHLADRSPSLWSSSRAGIRGALLGALLFGGIEALIPQVAAAGIRVPEYFMLMTPYLATLGVMVWQGIRGKVDADAPAALGQPYVREERT